MRYLVDSRFTELFERYWKWSVVVAQRSKWSSCCDPEDLAQEGLFTLWRWLRTNPEESEEHTKARLRNYMRSAARQWRGDRRVGKLHQQQLTDQEWNDLPDDQGGV